ncbi:hypothetical protein [Halorussus halophilus]|uniref:hypothetical protein n=1 Tax=Halorussus halophilus TaxID=2650975 RepID=UPI0013015436|nr:hypothetical protein [Halorussus halophilus]
MPTSLGWLYIIGGTVLFFFWAYGIVSFVRDTKNKFVPAGRKLLASRREEKAKAERDKEREEKEQQLY